MPVPVFEQPKPKTVDAQKEEKTSGGAAFFAIVFVLMLSITVELALLDVNKLYNPRYDSCKSSGTLIKRIFETNASPALCNVEQYEAARLLLHANVLVPMILISILVIVILNMRKRSLIGRIFKVALIIFASWTSLRIVYEALAFSLKHHPLFGKYYVLLTALITCTLMVVWLQRSNQKKKDAAVSN